MESERTGATPRDDRMPGWPLDWGTSFILGLITLILGVILAFRPTESLTVIAVLLGIAMIVSGIFHIVRAFRSGEHERVWHGIAGVLFILAGIVLIRHLNLTVALIGLFIGFTWIIQGVAVLMGGFPGRHGRAETGWSVLFGVISLIAGIVVISAPIVSVAALTIFMGAWFIVMGLMEMFGAFLTRRAAKGPGTGPVSVPGQRSDESASGESASGQGSSGRGASGTVRGTSGSSGTRREG